MPSSETFDVAVLGGGITGAAVAREAARRGFSVALFEKGDYASGASSKSSKLIHGGQRYLESFRFGLVRESCRERAALSAMAPHLVRPLPFLFAAGEARAPARPILAAGLALYRILAAGTGARGARWLEKGDPAIAAEAPGLDPEGWTGAYRYRDAQADDVLLTLAFLRDAAARGARLSPYTAVRRIARAAGGAVAGVEIEDGTSGERRAVAARVVVSALGPWSNALSALVGEDLAPAVRPSRGAHFYLGPGRLPVTAAVVLLDREGRRCYAIPWRGGTLLGTTDADDPRPPDDVAPTGGDREILLDAARRFFPSADLCAADFGDGFAGLRPLAAADPRTPASRVSREEAIGEPVPRLVVSVGGKLTTARATARRVIDHVEGILRRDFDRGGRAAPEGPLPGGAITDFGRFREELRRHAFRELGFSEAQADRVLEREGADAAAALARMAREPELARPISAWLPYTVADLVWGVEIGGARMEDDLLARRTRLAWESPAEAEAARDIAADVLRRYRAKPLAPAGV